jgi:hypothetical protein
MVSDTDFVPPIKLAAETPSNPTDKPRGPEKEKPDETGGPGAPQPHTDEPAVPGEPPNTSDD